MQSVLNKKSAFSLVEVTMAIGIVAFAFVALFALLPQGMNTFRKAMETSICVGIAQKVIGDAQQADFTDLTDAKHLPTYDPATAGLTFRAPAIGAPETRYFDEQGDEVVVSKEAAKDPKQLSSAESVRISYWVNTRIMPWASLPGTSDRRSKYLASVTVQVAFNPAGKKISIDESDSSNVESPNRNLFVATEGVSILTYSSLIARNQ